MFYIVNNSEAKPRFCERERGTLHPWLSFEVTKVLLYYIISAMLYIVNKSEAKPRFCERNH